MKEPSVAQPLVLLPLASSSASPPSISASKPLFPEPIASASNHRLAACFSCPFYHWGFLCSSPEWPFSSSCFWSRTHCIATVKHKKTQIRNQIKPEWEILINKLGFLGAKMTLGPAGPPLHKGVLEVPQSAQVFLWPSSDEPTSGVLIFISSDSDPCNTRTKTDPISSYLDQNKKRDRMKALDQITHFIAWIQHFLSAILKI